MVQSLFEPLKFYCIRVYSSQKDTCCSNILNLYWKHNGKSLVVEFDPMLLIIVRIISVFFFFPTVVKGLTGLFVTMHTMSHVT